MRIDSAGWEGILRPESGRGQLERGQGGEIAGYTQGVTDPPGPEGGLVSATMPDLALEGGFVSAKIPNRIQV